MRAPILTLLAILALLCQGQACPAQGGKSGKEGAPQTLTGPGGSDQRNADGPSLPGEGQDPKGKDPKGDNPHHDDAAAAKKEATEPGKPRGRVGTLSPDEERRAARARKRASSKATPDRAGETDGGSEGSRGSRPAAEREVSVERQRAKAVTSGRRAAQRLRGPDKADRRKASGPAMGVPPNSRRLAEKNWRGPRVGDVVPPRFRLFPLPPAYGPGGPGFYGPRPGYATATEVPPPYPRRQRAEPGFPPYPRYRDDDEDFDE